MLPTTLQAQRERARAAAQMLALSSAVELHHRYTMARVGAEQEAIRIRRKRNFWRSRLARRSLYALMLALGLAGGWGMARLHSVVEPKSAVVVAPPAVKVAPTEPSSSTGIPTKADATMAVAAVEAATPSWQEQPTVDVPFAHQTGHLGRRGLATVREVVAASKPDTRFAIQGRFGSGETQAQARQRVLAVQAELARLGVSADRRDVSPPLESGEAPSDGVLVGAQITPIVRMDVVAARPAPGDGALPVPGMPMPLGGDLPSLPAFRVVMPDPTQAGAPPEGPGVKAKAAQPLPEELDAAVRDAAERNRTARQATPSATTGSTKPPAGAAQQAGRDATARNDSGVAVTLRRDSGATDQRPSRPDPGSASGKTDSGEGGFSVIARTETTVLVRQGNSVKHYALGEVLPDGRKVTEQDLRAPVR